MKRLIKTAIEIDRSTGARTAWTGLSRPFARFARDEDGVLIIFGLFIFGLMMVISGLSLDLMRYEASRMRLQSTSDRAALAAASLTQSLDPAAVVADYFAKANMSQHLESVVVDDDFGYRRVDVVARVNVPLHFGDFSAFSSDDGTGGDVLIANAASTAMEAIGDVEISMVLDISGSMGSYNRLTNLKVAARNFIDTIYDSAQFGTVSTSIVPYSEQVTAGSELLSYYNRGDSAHTNSFCLNFSTNAFATTALSTEDEQDQTLHFDRNTSSGWEPDDSFSTSNIVCRTGADRRILPWSDDPDELKDHVDGLDSGGNTSTDLGMKWGTALLDPGTQEVLSGMIDSGDVNPDFSGRPEEFDDEETMKIVVVMSDGENTSQRYMDDPYRIGDTAVYFWEDGGGGDHFSVWGGEGEPDFDPEPECTKWNNGKCKNWDTPEDWYLVNDAEWASTPYGGETSVRLTWLQLWAKIPVKYFTDQILEDMGVSSTERNAIRNSIETIGGSTKDSRMAANCTAAKNAGITIFAVALETNDLAAGRLESCASSPAHFYRVTGSEIDFAFQSIASQINMLRLVH